MTLRFIGVILCCCVAFHGCRKNKLEGINTSDNFYHGYMDVPGIVITESYRENCRYYAYFKMNTELNILPASACCVEIYRDGVFKSSRPLGTSTQTGSLIDVNIVCNRKHDFEFRLLDIDGLPAGNSVTVNE